MLECGLAEALFGRRCRRFFLGADPDRVFAYKSKHDVTPLSELENSWS
jgi:hypothetical protein